MHDDILFTFNQSFIYLFLTLKLDVTFTYVFYKSL